MSTEEAGETTSPEDVENGGESRNVELLDPEKSLRRWCLVKGYAGLLCHLLTITAIVLVFMYCVPVTDWVYKHSWPVAFWLSLVMTLLSMVLIVVTCLRQASYPWNLVAVIILTACAGIFLGVAYCAYKLNEIVITVGIAATTSLVLLVLSIQTKLEFTILRGLLVVIVTDLIMFGILVLTLPRNGVLTALYSGLVVLPFLLYIVYDSNLVVTGRPSHSLIKNIYALP